MQPNGVSHMKRYVAGCVPGGGGGGGGVFRFFFDGGVPQPTMKWGSKELTTRVKYRSWELRNYRAE